MKKEYWRLGSKFIVKITKDDGSTEVLENVECDSIPQEVLEDKKQYYVIEEKPSSLNDETLSAIEEEKKEMVNHPIHYGGDTEYECIKVLKAWMTKDEFIGFCKGNALKYLCRSGKKDEILQEYNKAKWYIEKMIERIKVNN